MVSQKRKTRDEIIAKGKNNIECRVKRHTLRCKFWVLFKNNKNSTIRHLLVVATCSKSTWWRESHSHSERRLCSVEKKRGRLCSWRPLHYQFRYDAVFVIAETTLGLSSGIPPYVLLFAYLLSFLSFMLFSLSLSFSALLLQPGSLFVPAWLCNAYLSPSLTNQAPSHPFASFLFSWNVSTVDHFADLHLLNFSCRPLISFHERTRIHILPFPCKNLLPTLPYPSHLLSTLAWFHFTNLHLKDTYTLSSTGLKNKFF